MIRVRFMSLSGKFAFVREQDFAREADALSAVKEHCEPHGFTNVQLIDGDTPEDARYTARTPGGRGGRNVAFVDYLPEGYEP